MSNKSALYIAFHYPPVLGSSGVLRSLAFTRHLADNGWHTVVISASLQGYDAWSNEQMAMLPHNVEVVRGFCRNSAKSFSIKGKYLSLMALPDNWQSWIVGGVISGLNAIRKQRPSVIVSTYPIASAHIIALILHKLTGIPWVADFRDPMAQDDYPADLRKRRIFQWIEKKAVKHAAAFVVTTKGTQALYRQRYAQADPQLFQLIPNGYDAVAFAGLASNTKQHGKTVILHSGIIYPSERDPTSLFKALAALKQRGEISAQWLEIRLRATGHDQRYAQMLEQYQIADLVQLAPIIPYQQALQEMYNVDGLLLMQAANCNFQIPAKVYEYIKVNKPILGLMPLEGDTGQLVDSLVQAHLCPLDDQLAIEQTLLQFLSMLAQKKPIEQDEVEQYSRQYQAQVFEQVLSSVIN